MMALWSQGLTDAAAARKEWRLRNNDTPCMTLTALGTLHVLVDLIP